MNYFKLGILYKNGEIVNHRSLSKIIFNPILRYFGYYIGSIFENNKLIEYKLSKCIKSKTIKYTLETNEYDTIVFKNIF